jgi:hypothetical protein
MNLNRRMLALAILLSVWATAPHLGAQGSTFTPPTAPDGRIPIIPNPEIECVAS